MNRGWRKRCLWQAMLVGQFALAGLLLPGCTKDSAAPAPGANNVPADLEMNSAETAPVDPAVAMSDPAVAMSDPAVAVSDPAVAVSGPALETAVENARSNEVASTGKLAGASEPQPRPAANTAAVSQGGAVTVDPELPDYQPVPGVSGTLKSVGSDTMNNLMTLWAEGFRRHYPGVQVEVEGKGSGTAPPALVEGTAQFGPMSRDMKSSEVADFKAKFGYEPARLQTGIDLLAVYVHKDNSIDSLSLPEVDAMFSQTRRRGHSPVTTWGQAGIEGRLSNLPLSLYGRNAASGTYGFFKEKVLEDGDFLASVKEQPGSSAVVQGVAEDLAGIGYSGIGYKTSGVRAIAIAKSAEGAAVEPNTDNVYNGKYPLFRFLNLYVNNAPHRDLDPVRREFLKYVFSKQGQEVVVKDGYFPIPAALAAKELQKVGIQVEQAK